MKLHPIKGNYIVFEVPRDELAAKQRFKLGSIEEIESTLINLSFLFCFSLQSLFLSQPWSLSPLFLLLLYCLIRVFIGLTAQLWLVKWLVAGSHPLVNIIPWLHLTQWSGLTCISFHSLHCLESTFDSFKLLELVKLSFFLLFCHSLALIGSPMLLDPSRAFTWTLLEHSLYKLWAVLDLNWLIKSSFLPLSFTLGLYTQPSPFFINSFNCKFAQSLLTFISRSNMLAWSIEHSPLSLNISTHGRLMNWWNTELQASSSHLDVCLRIMWVKIECQHHQLHLQALTKVIYIFKPINYLCQFLSLLLQLIAWTVSCECLESSVKKNWNKKLCRTFFHSWRLHHHRVEERGREREGTGMKEGLARTVHMSQHSKQGTVREGRRMSQVHALFFLWFKISTWSVHGLGAWLLVWAIQS
jgi:hypothetical protein